MRAEVTVLYEDRMQTGAGGAFPPHDLVLKMTEDRTGISLFTLRARFEAHPCNGVSKLLGELGRERLYGGQRQVCVLVDRDRIAEHVGLPKLASDEAVARAVRDRSCAQERVSVFLLVPNMEGLMRSGEACDPSRPAPRVKDLNARDTYLRWLTFQPGRATRDCVQGRQPGLAGLVSRLVELSASAAPVAS